MGTLGGADEKTQQAPKAKNTRANHNDTHWKFMFRAVNKPNGNTHVELKQAAFINQLSFLVRGVKQALVPNFWVIGSPSNSHCRFKKKFRKRLNDADGVRALGS
jgi:hypothetical protein